MRVKSRYKAPTADTAVSQGQSELADVPRSGAPADTAPVYSGNDPSMAFQQQLDALNEAEQAQHDRTTSFHQQMTALHPERSRTQEAAPPPLTPPQYTRDPFQPRPERSASAAHYSAPVSREVPDSTYHQKRQ